MAKVSGKRRNQVHVDKETPRRVVSNFMEKRNDSPAGPYCLWRYWLITPTHDVVRELLFWSGGEWTHPGHLRLLSWWLEDNESWWPFLCGGWGMLPSVSGIFLRSLTHLPIENLSKLFLGWVLGCFQSLQLYLVERNWKEQRETGVHHLVWAGSPSLHFKESKHGNLRICTLGVL